MNKDIINAAAVIVLIIAILIFIYNMTALFV